MDAMKNNTPPFFVVKWNLLLRVGFLDPDNKLAFVPESRYCSTIDTSSTRLYRAV